MPDTINILQVEPKRVPLDSLVKHPSNYKAHPQAQLNDLKASLIRFGQVKPVVVQRSAGGSTYMILAGHGITEAMTQLVEEKPKVFAHFNEVNIVIVPPSWSAVDAKAYLVADNETGNKAENDEAVLLALLEEQKNAGYDLSALGSSEEELNRRLSELADTYLDESDNDEGNEETDDGPDLETTGEALALLDITIAEPRHEVHNGDIWRVGKHTLVIAHVFKDWPIWIEYLNADDCLFLPFPGPMVPHSKKAQDHTLILVQPDCYIAGHILDRYEDVFGAKSLKKIDHVETHLQDIDPDPHARLDDDDHEDEYIEDEDEDEDE